MDESAFAKRLEKVVDQAGGATQVAILMGLANSKVYTWINGRYFPSAKGLADLATATDCNLNWLLLGEGPMYRT